jgi:hypothetical protein
MTKKRPRGRFTYADDRKLIQIAAGSATLEEAAAMFGTSIGVMDRMAKRLGLALEKRDGRKRLSSGLKAKGK